MRSRVCQSWLSTFICRCNLAPTKFLKRCIAPIPRKSMSILVDVSGKRLMGRTRTNKIVVFEGNEELIGEIVHVQVQQANGFSLYGLAVRAERASGFPTFDCKPEACATLATF